MFLGIFSEEAISFRLMIFASRCGELLRFCTYYSNNADDYYRNRYSLENSQLDRYLCKTRY